MINVIVFSTVSDVRPTIQIAGGSTWSELQVKVNEAGVSTENMKAMIRHNKTTLENGGAIIPDQDFTLMVTPGKVKAGTIN
jgi:hypothetical protein|tara:strand:- start:8435 stop:8677 length:243 start_codon:yes stop_codon:yes gene_type:complete